MHDVQNTTLVYHGGCNDGFCAAWLFHHAYPEAELIPATYGAPPPLEKLKDRHVWFADFSYKRPVMIEIAASARSLTVLEHHKSAEAELAGFDMTMGADVTFDMNRSGGRLMWERLSNVFADHPSFDHYTRAKAPWLVDYTEDRDLWRFVLPNSREINAALSSYEMTHGMWDHLHRAGTSRLAEDGKAILRDQANTVAKHVARAHEINLAGYAILAVNATTLVSEIAGELAKGRPFGACYFDRADGLRQWSLRSRGDFDVEVIATAFGGGGHKNAAGFEMPNGRLFPCPS